MFVLEPSASRGRTLCASETRGCRCAASKAPPGMSQTQRFFGPLTKRISLPEFRCRLMAGCWSILLQGGATNVTILPVQHLPALNDFACRRDEGGHVPTQGQIAPHRRTSGRSWPTVPSEFYTA